MAISVVTSAHGPDEISGFILNATSADASGCEELRAAPTSGSIIVSKVTINSTAAISVTIGAGETTGGVTSAIVGPVAMAATSTVSFDFTDIGGMKLPAQTALVVDASGAGNIAIVVTGYVQ